MAAPNGARKTRQHHPWLAVSIDQTVSEALRCYRAGASILHGHVRGKQEEHVLDPGLYLELIAEMSLRVPEMLVQMTTEAVGQYTPHEQADCVYAVHPKMISIAVREMAGKGGDLDHARAFYHWNANNNIHVQHIVFDAQDLTRLMELQNQGVIPATKQCVLFVLGRYIEHRESVPEDIEPFLRVKGDLAMDWFVCAFGRHEQDCALSAIEQGGHARVGFENNLLLADGSQAKYSADLVAALKKQAEQNGHQIADVVQTISILGLDASPEARLYEALPGNVPGRQNHDN